MWSANLTWRIEFTESVAKTAGKLDTVMPRRLTHFLRERVVLLKDPRSLGATLKGDELDQFRKYRVGDYRIIAEIVDREIRFLVVHVGNSRDVYR
jgi:mRNA interferase RelE/StbE